MCSFTAVKQNIPIIQLIISTDLESEQKSELLEQLTFVNFISSVFIS